MIPFSKTDSAVTVVIQGVPHSVPKGDLRYGKVISGIKDGISELDMMALLQDVPEVASVGRSEEDFFAAVSVVDDVEYNGVELLFEGTPANAYTNDKARALFKEGFSLVPLANFIKRLQGLESFRLRESLLEFLDYGGLPLMEDGRFVAFKKVRDDFLDIHSGTFDNSPGQIVTMPRRDVDDNPNNTCSSGLHVCSHSYLAHFGSGPGNRVVACAVAPEDVVSIPADYNNTKMRCSGYEVLNELEGWASENVLSRTSQYLDPDADAIFGLYERNETDWESDPDEDDDDEGWALSESFERFSEAMAEVEAGSENYSDVSYKVVNLVTHDVLALVLGTSDNAIDVQFSDNRQPTYKAEVVENDEVVEWGRHGTAAEAYQWGYEVLKRRPMATARIVNPDGSVHRC